MSINQSVISKHPRGLGVLFFLELWDRFVFYGIQSLLVLYLVHHFQFSERLSFAALGVYTTFAFATPVLGGVIADRWLGYRRAIILGMLFIIAGNGLLLHAGLTYLYFGLAIILTGIGFFKSNNASLLGSLYQPSLALKESGYTIFYMGMNSGAVFGPLVFGALIIHYGYRPGFIVGALGFTFNLFLFLSTKRWFSVYRHPLTEKLSKQKLILSLLIAALIVLAMEFFFHYPRLFKDTMVIFFIATLISMLVIAYKQRSPYRERIVLLLILFMFALSYYATNLQTASSLMLFVDFHVRHAVLGFNFPTEWFLALSPLFIIVMAPFVSAYWQHRAKQQREPALSTYVLLSLLCGAISFFIFALAAHVTDFHGINLPLWLVVLGIAVLSLGELLIAPSLMAGVSSLLPENFRSTFMGFFFLFIAFGAYVSSVLAMLTASSQEVLSTSLQSKAIYSIAFIKIGLFPLVAAIVLWLLKSWLLKLGKTQLPSQ